MLYHQIFSFLRIFSAFIKFVHATVISKSSRPEVFLGKDVLKICSKFTGEHLCRFIEIALRHGCSPVILLHIFRTTFPKNTSARLLLNFPVRDFSRVLYPLRLEKKVMNGSIPISKVWRYTVINFSSM